VVLHQLRKKHKLDINLTSFTISDVEQAIRVSRNSTAVGPDGLTAIHLKNIGPRGLANLTQLFNLSTRHAELPAIWKAAIIVLILKPGKPAYQGSSYRPISLPSPAAKILERPLLSDVTAALPKHKTQHGYTPMLSTVSALFPIPTQVAIGFNDISEAFDSVDHMILIEEIGNSPLHSNYVCWLAAYLRGRMAHCLYNGALSPPRIIRSGVPQGSMLLPAIINFFISDCPTQAEVHSSFADDIDLLESVYNLDNISVKLNSSVGTVAEWADIKNLVIVPRKLEVTLFTPNTKEVNVCPEVSINGTFFPLNRIPKNLGQRWDTIFCYNKHSSENKKKIDQCLPIFSALGG
jgi:hypothetical protein